MGKNPSDAQKEAMSVHLCQLKADLPQGRRDLSEEEKRELVSKLGGPRTTRDIVRAKKDFPLARIPFLFSSCDTQAVMDVLCNDMDTAIEQALSDKPENR